MKRRLFKEGLLSGSLGIDVVSCHKVLEKELNGDTSMISLSANPNDKIDFQFGVQGIDKESVMMRQKTFNMRDSMINQQYTEEETASRHNAPSASENMDSLLLTSPQKLNIRDDPHRIELTKLDDNLYISNLKTAQQIELLKQEGITHVINLIAHKNLEIQNTQITKPSLPLFGVQRAENRSEPASQNAVGFKSKIEQERKQRSIHQKSFHLQAQNFNSSNHFYRTSEQCSLDSQMLKTKPKALLTPIFTSQRPSQFQMKQETNLSSFQHIKANQSYSLKKPPGRNLPKASLSKTIMSKILTTNKEQVHPQTPSSVICEDTPLVDEEKQIEYLNLSMRDQVDCDITFYLYAAIEFIEAAKFKTQGQAKILVHCYKGNSRSATVLAGYFMWKKKLSYIKALDHIRERRGFIDPNLGFVGQLMSFDAKLQQLKAIQQPQSTGHSSLGMMSQEQLQQTKLQSSPFQHCHQSMPPPGTGQQQKQSCLGEPTLYSFTLSKERLISKTLTGLRDQQMTKDTIKHTLTEFIDRNGPLCLLQMKQCFILIVSRSAYLQQINQNDKDLLERGCIYLLKLCQFLAKYERASKICYIYKDGTSEGSQLLSSTTLPHEQQVSQMMKIADITKIKFSYPDWKIPQQQDINLVHQIETQAQEQNTRSQQQLFQMIIPSL